MHSGLRGVGEAVKEKKRKPPEVRVCAGVRVRAQCARVRTIVRLLGRKMEKWGGMRKKVGE